MSLRLCDWSDGACSQTWSGTIADKCMYETTSTKVCLARCSLSHSLKVIKVSCCWVVAPFHDCGDWGHCQVHGNHSMLCPGPAFVCSSSADVSCFPNKAGIVVWLGDPEKAWGQICTVSVATVARRGTSQERRWEG